MSLGLALNNALTGLRVNQQSIAVLSQNIANVNTVGYSRQVINQSAVTLGGQGSGVRIDDIVRKVDQYLQRSVQTQGANNAANQTVDTYFQRLQGLLGRPGAANSIDNFVTGFFNSLQQLAETPETNSLKSNAIASAGQLASQLSNLSQNTNDLRFEADREISNVVETVNGALDRLRSINDALNQASSLGQSTPDLLDNRDRELLTISENLDITTSFSSTGSVNITTNNGAALLEDGVRYQLRYSPASSVTVFSNDLPVNALQVVAFNSSGQEVGTPSTLISQGTGSQVTTNLTSGKLFALQQVRDQKFTGILDQLDSLASRIRDNVNALHNRGSGFPPATEFAGDRELRPSSASTWSGSVRIAVLRSDGQPVPSGYADETFTGIRPLRLDLASLNSGQGNGRPSLQGIVDEINNHFGPPGNKVTLGNLNNIQIVSDTNVLPSGAPPLFNFDLDLDNISDESARVFVTGISVFDDAATNITNVTQGPPATTIQPLNSYTTIAGLPDVTINLASSQNLVPGDQIFLGAPSGPVNGIPAANLTGFFTVTSVVGNAVTFTAGANATLTGSVNDPANVSAAAAYDTIAPGVKDRTRDKGELQLDFSGSPGSAYYDITLNVSVVDDQGNITSAPIFYRINNNESNLLNQRYDVQGAGAPASLVLPGTSQQSLRAILVDANGVELPTLNGRYIEGPAFLKLIGGNADESYGIAIDELDSRQLGDPNSSPPDAGTNRGFSHYFGLNNFFASNALTSTGDAVKGSAANLRVQERFITNPGLISTGRLVQQEPGAASNNQAVYTFVRFTGDNSNIQELASFNSARVSFDAIGGLPATEQSLQGYSSEILGFVSQRTSEAEDNARNTQLLLDGFTSRLNSASGVNLDEELANTITFQNAYSATARVITTVNRLYEDLLNAF